MLKCPRFKPHLQVHVRSGEGVFILSEMNQTVLQGSLYEAVAPLLDGRPVEAVCQQLGGTITPSHVFYTLNKLEEQGVLCEQDQTTANPQSALWSLQGIDPQIAAGRLARTPVSITSLGIDTTQFQQLLRSLGMPLADEGDVQIVVTDHYLRPELSDINRRALEAGMPWVLVKPVGAMLWIGPLFRPHVTGCWECLATRIRSNFPVLGYLGESLADQPARDNEAACTAATMSVAWGMAANGIASAIASDAGAAMLEGRLHTFNLITWQTETHTLLKQPACPSCGDRNAHHEKLARLTPLELNSCMKSFTADGGHRALSPQETLDKYSRHVSSICGAVSQLQKCSPANDGVMHVYVSGNNAARAPQSLMGLKTDLRHNSAGKGTTDVQAKASALCEALERYSGIFQGDEPRRLASFHALGDEAIHPNRCMLYSDRQYGERNERNANCSVYNYIPLPMNPEREIEWSPVWSLTQQRTRYLPTAFCYFKAPQADDAYYCVGCSNGNAAGNSLEEAVFQGFLELAERDSVALWWYNRLRLPEFDLDSLDDPYLQKLRTYLKSQHRDMWVLDVTSDLQIPTFVAVSRRTSGPTEQIMLGFGAHLDPRIAVLRAVTELNQMLMPLIQYSDENLPGVLSDPDTLRWLNNATVAEQSYLLPQDAPPTDIHTYKRQWTDDIRDDVLECQARVESRGMELCVLNQTRSEIGMPVVKVIVPGLRHFWSRYAPGRLYDVPVELGRLDKPLSETQLNPIAMFM